MTLSMEDIGNEVVKIFELKYWHSSTFMERQGRKSPHGHWEGEMTDNWRKENDVLEITGEEAAKQKNMLRLQGDWVW